MVKVIHFDKGADNVFSRVEEEVKKTINRPEMKDATHETIVKESIKSVVESVPASSVDPTPSPLPISTTTSNDDNSLLPSYLSSDDDSSKSQVKEIVEKLVKDVFTSGLENAIKSAKRYEPFVEDAFHDALIEKIVPELKKKGILK